jgi:hypothetical protein
MSRAKPPDDVEPDQLWRDPEGQHFRVVAVSNGIAELQRSTPAGRVLNPRFKAHAPVDRMQETWTLMSG